MSSVKDADERDKRSLDYAFKYFEIHANQRMTVFNFFLLLAGGLSGGIGASLIGANIFPLSGLFLSGLLLMLSLVFYKLDRRTSFLIKHAESALEKGEKHTISPPCRLVGSEADAFRTWQGGKSFLSNAWSYSKCFAVVFVGAAVVGLVGILYSVMLLCRIG